jgi:hypothetical protein
MVQSYSITESREKGGICVVDMGFIEYGDPSYRSTISSPSQIAQSAAAVESAVIGPPAPNTLQQIQPYSNVYSKAGVPQQ